MKLVFLRPEERYKNSIWARDTLTAYQKMERRIARKCLERERKHERVLICQARRKEQQRIANAKIAAHNKLMRQAKKLRKLRSTYTLKRWEVINLKAKWLAPWYEDELCLEK